MSDQDARISYPPASGWKWEPIPSKNADHYPMRAVCRTCGKTITAVTDEGTVQAHMMADEGMRYHEPRCSVQPSPSSRSLQ